MVQAGEEAFPNAGTAALLQGMGMGIPVIEAAHDGRSLSMGGPDGKAHPALDEVSTEKPMNASVLTHVEEVDI